jgi:hypothetical protein
MKKEKIAIGIFLVISVFSFYAFGFYHLAKFETVDEHFWKFERIPQYWDAIKNKNFKKTYINDKPGITVALISGIGLIAEPHPEELRVRDPEKTRDNLLTIYDSENSESINFSLRFPILIFNGLFLLYFFWIIRKITDSPWIAVFSVAFMAVSPILIGISQIINPDSFLWTFSAASIFSYFALIKTNDKKFIFLTALFTGFSLLSKYSANILFLFYLLILFSEYFIYFEKYKEESKKYFAQNLFHLLVIYLGSIAVFSFFLPAVFIKMKYLYRGTIGAPGFSAIVLPTAFVIFLTLADTFFLKNYFLRKLGSWLSAHQQKIFKLASGLILVIFLIVIANTLTGQKLIPFDQLGYDIYKNGKEIFGGVLQDNTLPIKFSKELLLQFYPFVFSQLPLILAIVFMFWIKIVFQGLKNYKNLVFFCLIVPVIYFSALIFSNVSANIRYSIMLYPLFALLGGMGAYELTASIKYNKKKVLKISIIFLIIISGILALWKIKPFYFNYANFLLPKKFIITDSWGYGEYEAAQFLNSLPEPEKILIWTDRSAICQFIKGSCIRDYKIDLNKTKPDYFVITKRGEIRHQFLWKYPADARIKSSYYYQKDSVWSIYIGGRPREFVKIIKSEE